MASTIYIPNIVYWSSFFSPTSQRLVCCHSFWWKPFWQVWSDISSWYWFVFPWWLMILRIFSWVCWVSVCLLQKKKNVFRSSAYFFLIEFGDWFSVFLILSTMRFFFYILDIKILVYWYILYQISDISFVNTSSQLVGCLFVLLMASFAL